MPCSRRPDHEPDLAALLRDADLDIVASSFSPGVRRLMGRVGGKEPFEEGRADLQAMAGNQNCNRAPS